MLVKESQWSDLVFRARFRRVMDQWLRVRVIGLTMRRDTLPMRMFKKLLFCI
ncbi:hypothetical protein HanPI659440_Chr06g0238961 [Helianthus annuus]|nr:hypothetical protein HanPI659440_Chr06g0238961 [Helianthus annuus]